MISIMAIALASDNLIGIARFAHLNPQSGGLSKAHLEQKTRLFGYTIAQKYYIMNSETNFDVTNYTRFSKINSKGLMKCNRGVPTTGQVTRHTPP